MPRLLLAPVAALAAATLSGCALLGAAPSGSRSASGSAPEPSATPAATEASATPSATAASSASDVPTRVINLAEQGSYGVVTLDLDAWDVRVDWPDDPDGTDLAEYIDDHPGIAVLTNAGIFSDDLTPGGLLVADGEELRALNLADGYGNFHLKPNAVFEIREDGTAAIVDSTLYAAAGVTQATQSGPALLLDGEIHPQFTEGSQNTALRTGVGVSPDGGTVYLAITRTYVNLWDFAAMFRDELGVEDALYLDGQISQLWVSGAPEPTSYLGPYAGVIAAYPR
ncbi:phosphodiester glycosidase family protein [Demequina rhizosphaerae]|uniref:phosphodiester glycosidase family protein n=1 Tax=Demequina rhizosphaerae TaxID=1638985 RepID=UPI00078042F4|nr:phosphodiester glycosidase family protein [Demequina rhizosphaerae]